MSNHMTYQDRIAAADEAQLKLFPERIEIPCGCYDGEDDDAE